MDQPTTPKSKSKHLKPWQITLLIVAALLILAGGSLSAYGFYMSNRILSHTQVAGVNVGGLTKAQATQAVIAKEQDFEKNRLILASQGKTWPVSVADLDLHFSDTEAINAAFAGGRSGSVMRQLKDIIKSFIQERSFDSALAPLSSAANQKLLASVPSELQSTPKETSLTFTPGNVQINPGTPGQELLIPDFANKLYGAFKAGVLTVSPTFGIVQPQVSVAQAATAQSLAQSILGTTWTLTAPNHQLSITPQILSTWLTTSVAQDTQGTVTGLTLGFNTTTVTKALKDFATSVNVTPTNATFTKTDSGLTVTLPDKPGTTLQVDQTLQALSSTILSNASNHTINAVTTSTPATIQASMSNSLQLIGTGTTNFSGSPAARAANIQTGVKYLNGLIIQNGDTFSTIGALKPITEAHGYVAGLVIIGNETIPEDGGGLCQVSTTLFRAVLNAGLPIVQRVNHSYEVSYYQRGIGPGLDATIYDPNPDFKWKNDTGHPIYVEATISGTNLTFNLYGTSDGRTSAIDGPKTLKTYPVTGQPIYTKTDTLPAGKTEMIDGPVEGASTTATYTVSQGGKVINIQVFNSYYQPMPAQYLVGTGK